MATFGYDNGQSFRTLAAALRKADKDLRVEVRKAINRATVPVKEEIKASAVQSLPHRGGLGAWVADAKLSTSSQFTGNNAGVRITMSKDKATIAARAHRKAARSRGKGKKKFFDHSGRSYVTGGGPADLWAINRGRVRHPYWGRWPRHGPSVGGDIQLIAPGFFDRAAEKTKPRVAAEIHQAMEDAIRKMPRHIP